MESSDEAFLERRGEKIVKLHIIICIIYTYIDIFFSYLIYFN